MSKVNTNDISLVYNVESSLGTAGTTWYQLEPNDISTFGATITTVPRRPISQDRQRAKGAVVDLDSAAEIEHDLTIEVVDQFIEQFVYSTATNSDMEYEGVAAVAGGWTIPAADATEAAKWQYAAATGPISLAYAQGYANSVNNGLFPLTSDLATSGTTLPVTGRTAEASPPTNARVEVAGIRAEAGDLAFDLDDGNGFSAITSNNGTPTNALDFTTLGLTEGQFIHVGGLTGTNQFYSAASTNQAGYARIVSIAANTLTLDKIDDVFTTDMDGTDDNSAGTEVQVDLLFGRFIRNVDVTSSEYLERSIQIEASYPNLGGTGVDEYEYSIGNLGNSLAFNMAGQDKATVTIGFIGTDTETIVSSQKTGASTPIEPLRTTAFGTASDIARIRTDALSGDDTCFKEVTLTLGNNISPEKCLGTLGATFMNTGIFQVDLEAQALFTDDALTNAIRNNTTVTFEMILFNDNGAVCVDIPALTFGGGDKEFPLDEAVRINLTGAAFQDPTLGTSIGVSLIPVVPTS